MIQFKQRKAISQKIRSRQKREEEFVYSKSYQMRLQAMQNKERKRLTPCFKKNSICRNGSSLSVINVDYLQYLKSKDRYSWLKFKAKEAIKKRKVFTVYGQGGSAVRRALVGRGWIEKVPRHRKPYPKMILSKKILQSLLSSLLEEYNPNFIWGGKRSKNKNPDNKLQQTNTSNVNKRQQKYKSPMRNRLKAVKHWSTKHGILSSLKYSIWHFIENEAEVIVPRTFSNANDYEKREFINDYQLTACTSLLRWIILNLQNKKPIIYDNGGISINIMVFAINRCKEYLYMKQHRDIDRKVCEIITEGQWKCFLIEYRILITGKALLNNDENRDIIKLVNCSKYLLKKMYKCRPQLRCEGYYNIWIIKPSISSRGVGIKMSSDLKRIMNLITKTKKRYVVQKYIEKPLLIYNTKFDIRQYYLVTSTYPLVIWMYTDCYLKFSSKNYSLQSFHKSIHLTNHAIQKHYKNSSKRHYRLPKNNMWDLNKYKSYLKIIGKQNVWNDVVYPSMRKVIVGIMLSNQTFLTNSRNRFGLFGCDFILDNNYTPWLIEINNRPDLGATTKVTATICPQVVADIIKVVIDYAKNPEAATGKFECIYRQPMTRISPYHDKCLEVIGSALKPNYFSRDENAFEAISCNSSRINGQSVFNMLKKLETIFEIDHDNRLDEGDNRDKNISTCKTQSKADTLTELIYDNRSVTDNSISQIEPDAMRDPDLLYTNSDLKTSNYMAQVEHDAVTESAYNDFLDVNSDVETNTYMAQIEQAEMNVDFLDAISDVETSSYMLEIVSDAIKEPDYVDFLDVNSDMEIFSGQIQFGS